MSQEEFDDLLKAAFLENNYTELLAFCESSPYQYVEYVVGKMIVDYITLNTDSICEKDSLISTILKTLSVFVDACDLDLKENEILVKCLLHLAADESCYVTTVKHAAVVLNKIFNSDSVVQWLKQEEALEGYMQIFGRRIPLLGDFECQIIIFEALCRFTYDDADKCRWAQAWFPDERIKSLFLSLNVQQFELECRRILNVINRNEKQPRTFAFVATFVYFGTLQMKKPHGLDFWIDFNLDSKSISFFCAEFAPDILETSAAWETVIISADDVESYSIFYPRHANTQELRIILRIPCKDLLETNSFCSEFESNVVRIVFWSFLDIKTYVKNIFGKPTVSADECGTENQSDVSGSQTFLRKASTSANIIPVRESTVRNDPDVIVNARKVSASSVLKASGTDKQCERSGRRASNSTKIICLYDANDEGKANPDQSKSVEKGQNVNISHKTKGSSINIHLKDSECQRDLQTNDIKQVAAHQINSHNDKHVYQSESFVTADNETHVSQNYSFHNSKHLQVSRAERKSSQASCTLEDEDLKSPEIIIGCDIYEDQNNETSESLLKDKNENLHEERDVTQGRISSAHIKLEKLNLTEEVKRQKYDNDLEQDRGNKYNIDKLPQVSRTKVKRKNIDNEFQRHRQKRCAIKLNEISPSETKSKSIPTNCKTINDFNETVSPQMEDACNEPILLEENGETQNHTNILNVSSRTAKSFSDLEETCAISPTPVKRKVRKSNKLTPEYCKKSTALKDPNMIQNSNVNTEDSYKNSNTMPETGLKGYKKLKLLHSDNLKDLSPYIPLKKVRLYNINRDPVYDVPPLEKKRPSVVSTKKDSQTMMSSILGTPHKGALRESSEQMDKGYNKTEEIPKIPLEIPAGSLESKESLKINLNNSKNKSSNEGQEFQDDKNSFHENENENDQEGRASKEATSYSRPFHSKKRSTNYQPRQKKARKAAVKARKKNKAILKEKEAKKYSEIENISRDVYSISSSNGELENLNPPATKPVKKRRLRELKISKSLFTTDTEAESSDLSGLRKKHSLYDTPLISSKRTKNKSFKTTSTRQKTYMPSTAFKHTKKKPKPTLQIIKPETKSKNVLSDLENYELIVEKKGKRNSNINKGFISLETASKAIQNALESTKSKWESTNVGYTNDEYANDDTNYVNIDSGIYNNAEFINTQQLQDNDVVENEYSTNSAREQTQIRSKNFKDSVDSGVNITRTESRQETRSQKMLKRSEPSSSAKDSTNNLSSYTKNIHEELSPRPVKERKSKKLPDFNEEVERKKKSDKHHIGLDTSTSFNTSNNLLHTFKNRESVDNNESSGRLGTLSNGIQNVFTPNIPISSETLVKVSPIFYTSNKSNNLIRKKQLLAKKSASGVLDTLTQENLSKLQDGSNGKDIKKRIEQYLESLSSESSSHKDVPDSDNVAETFPCKRKRITSDEENKFTKIQKSNPIENMCTSDEDMVSVDKKYRAERHANKSGSHKLSKGSILEDDYLSMEAGKPEQFGAKGYLNFRKRKNSFTNPDEPKSKLHASEKDLWHERRDLMDNYSHSWSQENLTDNYQKAPKIKEGKQSKKFVVFRTLAGEVNNLTQKLLGTLQRCTRDFDANVAAMRKDIFVTTSTLISKDTKLKEKDLENLARTCRESRLHVEKSLKRILSVGQEYFEAEKKHDRKMKQLHKKAMKKYIACLKIAQKMAIKALEERVISKTNEFLENIVKEIVCL